MSIIMKLATFSTVCGAMILATVHDLYASENKIASGRSHGLSISIVNESGKFVAGSNDFCVEFTKTITAEPVSVRGVVVEFAQQVGRIQERPIRAHITDGNTAQFCGQIDLGKQYYLSAFYYLFIHYTDTSGKKRKCRLSFLVRT